MVAIGDFASLLQNAPGLVGGWQEAIFPSAPASGANFTRAVPGQYWERLLSVTFTIAASAVASSRTPVVQLMDHNGSILSQSPGAPDVEAGDSVTAFLSPGQQIVTGGALSTSATNVVTSATAGQVITTLTLPGGRYNIAWQLAIGGTVGAPEQNNMALNANGVQIAVAELKGAAASPTPQPNMVVDIPAGGATVTITAVANATVGAQYFGQLTATPIQGQTWYAPILDTVMPSGWQVGIAINGIQAGDQISNIGMLVQRFPTSYTSQLSTG